MDKIIHLDGTKLKKELKELVREPVEETLTYMSFPMEHWAWIRTNNGLEHIMLEIRRRTGVSRGFPGRQFGAYAGLRRIAACIFLKLG